MTPIQDIKIEEIRGVVYLQPIKKGQVDAVRFLMMDGTTHTYHADDLPLALALAKERFRPEPDEIRMSDNPERVDPRIWPARRPRLD